MSDNTLLLVVVAAGAVVLLNKNKTVAAAVGIAPAPSTQTNNVQNDLWKSLLGTGWTMLKGAQNTDGSAAFLEKNFFGQTVTSDGKPVGSELLNLFPSTYGQPSVVDTTLGDGVDYLKDLFSFSAYE
jgi:hypothetical protein